MEELRRYDFEEAQPLIDFLSQNRDKIVGQKICRFYTDCDWHQSFEPFVMELEQFSVIINYRQRSRISLHIANSQQLQEHLQNWLWEQEDFPYLGFTIEGVDVSRSANAVETNPSTGAARPAGGDYFTTVTVRLCGGTRFFICAMPSFCDGGTDIWD